MTFVFPFILGGLALVGVPVLIHLIMRQKPRTIQFPAFRFLVKRHKKNLRKLRLRHLALLALRILLIAAICLAVAQPKVFNDLIKMGNDRPFAAIFVFDTSYSMEYKVAQEMRLADAQKRGRELLSELPDGSRVAILDTADLVQTGKGEWLTSLHQARERIDRLKLKHANAPVTTRLENAYRLFADLARSKDDDAGRQLTRLLCVFSDRTTGGWDKERLPKLHELREQIPPPYERRDQVRDSIPGVIDLLGELRTRLPPLAGQDYPAQAVIDLLGQLRERIGSASSDDYPDAELSALLSKVRARSRELTDKIRERDKVPDDVAEYRAKLMSALQTLARSLSGVHELFVDVGVDDPVDLAITDLELPLDPRDNTQRQTFSLGEKIILKAVLHASGSGFDTVLIWRVGNKTDKQVIQVKAGQSATFRLALDTTELGAGTHQVKVELATTDALAFNNSRFVTFSVRALREVLIITDDAAKADDWRAALEPPIGPFRAVVKTPRQALDEAPFDQYHAVHLFGVARPERDLWTVLKNYVHKGGGLAAIPPGDELAQGDNVQTYNSREAQELLPARFERDVKAKDVKNAGQWNRDKMEFQHPLIAPFRMWQNADVMSRAAKRYWLVQPHKADATVLVSYVDDGDPPALIERSFQTGSRRGRVLLFTTPFHHRLHPHPLRWNNYLETPGSLYVVMSHLGTRYLAGDAERLELNFVTGRDVPLVRLPLAPRFPSYVLRRDGAVVETLPVEAGQNELRLPTATAPGNYTIEGDEEKRVAWFSVNMPVEECLLKRVPVDQVDALFGAGSLVPVDFQTNLSDALAGQWNQPFELLPLLLVLLLVMLALENLLANKFYRREAENDTARRA